MRLAVRSLQHLCNAKVAKLNGTSIQLTLSEDENIGWLQVSVQDLVPMYVVQGNTDLNEDRHHRTLSEESAVLLSFHDPSTEIASVGMLHDNVQHVLIQDDVNARDDVIVRELAEELTLSERILLLLFIEAPYPYLLCNILYRWISRRLRSNYEGYT